LKKRRLKMEHSAWISTAGPRGVTDLTRRIACGIDSHEDRLAANRLDLRAAAVAAADASRRRVARPIHVAKGGNVSQTTTIAQPLLSAM
jgi:hypothetical protein